MDLAPLPASGFRRTPWKNGGGVTIDIAASYRDGAEPGSWSGMVWRFGRTAIVEPAPFSDLSGNDRILVVIGGRGLSLHAPDGAVIDAREPYRPVRFPGELALRSELDDGPVEVVNLMGDRRAVALDLTIADRPGRVAIPAGEFLLYRLTGEGPAELDGQAFGLPAGDAVRGRTDHDLSYDHGTGIAVIASIVPRA